MFGILCNVAPFDFCRANAGGYGCSINGCISKQAFSSSCHSSPCGPDSACHHSDRCLRSDSACHHMRQKIEPVGEELHTPPGRSYNEEFRRHLDQTTGLAVNFQFSPEVMLDVSSRWWVDLEEDDDTINYQLAVEDARKKLKDCPEGEHFEGQFQDKLRHGTGCLKWKDKTAGKSFIYEGEFRRNLKEGVGVMTWEDGRQYKGDFDVDLFHGNGMMIWPNGCKYTGQYMDGRKNGVGTFEWPDGRSYEGHWKDGQKHGEGVYTNKEGIQLAAQWYKDETIKSTMHKMGEGSSGSLTLSKSGVDAGQRHTQWSIDGLTDPAPRNFENDNKNTSNIRERELRRALRTSISTSF